ncbi:MAG: radical SAM protein [Clostridiales bacterium]|nr:radical SAM protein [Clostridiales bacterium]
MQYKKSNYVLELYNSNKDLLLYNVRTTKTIKIHKADTQKFISFINQKTIDIPCDQAVLWQKELIEEEIIIPFSFDEQKWCQYKQQEVIYGTKELDVLLVPTNMCNFRCTYCFQSHADRIMTDDIEQRIIRFLEKKIPKSQIFRIGLFGGEPLLCTDTLLRILYSANEICKKNGIPMAGEISTNGYLLTPDILEKFLRLRIFDFQVCVDGPKECHNKTRPHITDSDSFSVIMRNLKEIKSKVKSKNYRMTIRINLTPSAEAFLDDFLKELAAEFSDHPCFQIAIQCVRDWGGDSITCDQIVDDEPSRYKKWYERIRELGMSGAGKLYFTPFTYCIAYRKNGFIIDYDGKITKCTHATSEINNVGHIDEKGNEHISEAKVAEWYVSDIDKINNSECMNCVLYPFCMGGYCAYAKNIKKNISCNYDITMSMLREKLLDLDEKKQIPVLEWI